MSEARLERIVPDPTLSAAFLGRARRFLADGSDKSNARESRQVLLHSATIAATDSILAINGFEVEGSDGGHVLRLEKAEELLDADLADLFEQLDAVRMTRARVSYAAGFAAEP